MTTPEIERIRAALEAGPTPGEWGALILETAIGTPFGIITGGSGKKRDTVICHGPDFTDERKSFNAFRSANGEYIAACNPAAMTAVLAHIDAQQVEIEARLKDAVAREMEIERLRADAARYRWLRKTTNFVTSKGERIDVRNSPDLWDRSIDAAIKETP